MEQDAQVSTRSRQQKSSLATGDPKVDFPEYSANSFSPALRIRMLVLQPTPFCNLQCDYCYLAHRDDREFMPLDVLEAALSNAARCGLVGPELELVWHAGEPLVASQRFYSQAFELSERLCGSTTKITHRMQTNGSLISSAWCALFKAHSVRVGVSVDGPAFVHDRHRRSRSGHGTHAVVMRALELLRLHDIAFKIIAVITRDALDHADEIVEFFTGLGATEVGFNVDEQEGLNGSSTLDGEDSRYRLFLDRVYKGWARSRSTTRLRELEHAVSALLVERPFVAVAGMLLPENAQVVPFAITSVDWRGNFSTFSPELLDQQDREFGDFLLGNVFNGPMIDAIETAKFQRLMHDVLSGVSECRRSCSYFDVCGGGVPVNKLNENGSFATAETGYCRRAIQMPLDLGLEYLESVLADAAASKADQ